MQQEFELNHERECGMFSVYGIGLMISTEHDQHQLKYDSFYGLEKLIHLVLKLKLAYDEFYIHKQIPNFN